MFDCKRCETHAQELREQRMFFEGLIKELTDKIMSRDLSDYQSAKQPVKDTSEIIKPEDSPYLELEDVPDQVSSPDLDNALHNAKLPNS